MKTVFGGVTGKKRQALLWGGVGVLVLAAGIGGGLTFRALHHTATPSDGAQAQANRLPEPAGKAQDLAAGGNYAAAHQQLDTALHQQGLSNSDKYALYFQQGATYANEGKYQAAIDSFKQAEAVTPSQSLAEAIANAYEQLGDKPNAIVYYKKAISLISSDSPVGDDDKSVLEQKVRDLGGQP
jgi:tetratricopeptide (TPR) repeat protein